MYYILLKNNTSSISLVFDFSNESTLACRLLTVLLREKRKKALFKMTYKLIQPSSKALKQGSD